MSEMIQYGYSPAQVLKYEVGHAVFCPGCQSILDVKRSAYLEHATRGTMVRCGRCFEKTWGRFTDETIVKAGYRVTRGTQVKEGDPKSTVIRNASKHAKRGDFVALQISPQRWRCGTAHRVAKGQVMAIRYVDGSVEEVAKRRRTVAARQALNVVGVLAIVGSDPLPMKYILSKAKPLAIK